MVSPSDWKPIPKDKRRRYVNVRTGETISRRQYLNKKRGMTPEAYAALEAAKRQTREPTREFKMGRYNSLVRHFRARNPGEHVRGPKAQKFRTAVKMLYVHRNNNNPYGPKARALEILGLREPAWRDQFNVGDSPTGAYHG